LAQLRILVLALLIVASIVLVCVLSPKPVFDPVAMICAGYVLMILLLQVSMMEWPHGSLVIDALALLALMAVVAPAIVKNYDEDQDYWTVDWRARGILWAYAVLVAAVAYTATVRGPSYQLRAGSQQDRVAVITGCNTGIGYETAKALAMAGATVVFACRTESKARAAMERLVAESGERVSNAQLLFLPLDLSSLRSVRSFASKFEETGLDLHLLVLNAGAILVDRRISEDGLDMNLVSNHLGHFLLTQLLLPAIRRTEQRGGQPRIVQLSSALAYKHSAFDFSEAVAVQGAEARETFLARPYEKFHCYGQAKLAGMLCLMELDRHLRQSGSTVPVYAVHPGEIFTDIFRDFGYLINCLTQTFRPFVYGVLKTTRQGSLCSVFACTSPSLATSDKLSGRFLMRLAPAEHNQAWLDEEACKRMWQVSLELTGARDWA
jgi:NAD(P)-dependent dehydrogenase (short-subunit alcohol dehydrogenase family)